MDKEKCNKGKEVGGGWRWKKQRKMERERWRIKQMTKKDGVRATEGEREIKKKKFQELERK